MFCLFSRSMSSTKRSESSVDSEQQLLIDLTTENPDLSQFPHPFHDGDYGSGRPPKSLNELKIMRFSGAIRSKVNWYEKMKNETIVNKWKQEALEQNILSEKQIDYVLDELEYYDSIRDGSLEMSAVDGVWQSDDLIPSDVKQSLVACVAPFENVPEKDKDWHPGTNQQVLDLIHPSLFCFVNEVTRIITDKERLVHLDNTVGRMGEGEILDMNLTDLPSSTKKIRRGPTSYARSNTYQWLPAEFHVSETGQVTIESYINNLRPTENVQFYKTIAQIFERFVPLFNKVLTDLINGGFNRIYVDGYNWYDTSKKNEVEEDEEEDDDEQDRFPLIVPDVGKFSMPDASKTEIDLRGRKLQVIVKLANIILTPDNPQYPGGAWHVEGMENEHIVASGIYYYSSSNLTQSDLQFRTAIYEPDYQQNDDRGVATVYGLQNNGPLNQSLGSIITQEDRCIAFPNIYQHRVAPFELKDRTQIGIRKILVFFLVDPSVRIISTAHVPPQQSEWYCDVIRNMSPFKELPALVIERILHYVQFPMTLGEAKEHREKLMAERKYFISENNKLSFERPFSLCEH